MKTIKQLIAHIHSSSSVTSWTFFGGSKMAVRLVKEK